MRKILLIIFIILITHSANAQNYALYPNIDYNTISGINPNLLSLDIYKPTNYSGNRPVMIYIHGGYWNAGDKWFVGEKAKLFNDSEYVFVSINYRLSPDPIDTLKDDAVRFPTHPEDCARAIRWVYDSISNYYGDNSKISLIGHSAGAHLVLLLSTNESFLKKVGLSLNRIKCTCSLDAGVFDVTEELKQAGNNITRRAPLINAFGKDTSMYDDASPQYNIFYGKDIPDMLLIHQNTPDRIYGNNRFKDSLVANGYIRITLFNANPYDHGQINSLLGSSEDTNGETIELMNFLRNCLSQTTNVMEEEKENLIISPNPASEYIEIPVGNRHACSLQDDIKIYNAIGECVLTAGVQNFEPLQKIDISHLPAGVYYLELGNRASKFVIIK